MFFYLVPSKAKVTVIANSADFSSQMELKVHWR
jgi:hypothetical protein